MRSNIIGLAALVVACSPPKVRDPVIPKITISGQNTIIEEIPEGNNNSTLETPYQAKRCQEPKLEQGTYFIEFNHGAKKYFNISDFGCSLYFEHTMLSIIHDKNCDEFVDELLIFSSSDLPHKFDRETLEKKDYTKKLDRLLQDAEQFVCPENRAATEEYLLQEILKNYK